MNGRMIVATVVIAGASTAAGVAIADQDDRVRGKVPADYTVPPRSHSGEQEFGFGDCQERIRRGEFEVGFMCIDDEHDPERPHVTPEMRLEWEQAIRDAGLEDAPSVRGRYVPGNGWEVEATEPDEDGWTRYAPVEDPPS